MPSADTRGCGRRRAAARSCRLPEAETGRAAARRRRSGWPYRRASRGAGRRRSRPRAPCGSRGGASWAAARRGSPMRRRPAPARPAGRSRAGRSGSRRTCRRRRPACRRGAREAGEVGDAAVGDDQLRVGVALDEVAEVVCDRREAAAAVDQDRDAALGGEREDGSEPVVVQKERLRTRMELDPARAAVEAALGLLDRSSRRGRAARTGSGGRRSARRGRACGRSLHGRRDDGRARRGRT